MTANGGKIIAKKTLSNDITIYFYYLCKDKTNDK